MTRRPIPWDYDLLRELWLAGVPTKEIAARFGTNPKRVSGRAIEIGLPKRQKGSGAVRGYMAEVLYLQGNTLQQVADQLGSNISTIRRVLLSRGVKTRPQSSRFYNDTTTRIIQLYRKDPERYTYSTLGKMFGLKPNQVGHRIRKVLGSGPHGGPRKCKKSSSSSTSAHGQPSGSS